MPRIQRAGQGVKTEEQRLAHHRKMTETPVNKLIGTLAIPSILTMMTTSIYNTADTYFVSQLGTSASGAVGVCLSLMTLIQTAGFTLGMGSCNYVAKLLGEQKDREASEGASTAFFAAIFFGIVAIIIGTIFMPQIMRLLGATETILPYAQEYARYILYAAPLMGATCMMN
ncbi:MAG: MATE family efflux transporter, partial [Oscillospiraceae bacterium]|nr:MATE family efflux transporter [Oscillospiraceae bacterium]